MQYIFYKYQKVNNGMIWWIMYDLYTNKKVSDMNWNKIKTVYNTCVFKILSMDNTTF